MREAIAAAFPEPVKISNPRGGFVLWVELPPKVNAMELFSEARKAGISIAPGPIFSPAAIFTTISVLAAAFHGTTRSNGRLPFSVDLFHGCPDRGT